MTPVQRASVFQLAVGISATLVSVLLWLLAYRLGGLTLLSLVGATGLLGCFGIGWWLHTWSDRPQDGEP